MECSPTMQRHYYIGMAKTSGRVSNVQSCSEMKWLKQTLRLHVQYFSNLNSEVNSLRERVKTVQEQLQVNPTCLLLLKQEKEVGLTRVSYLAEMCWPREAGLHVEARR